MNRKFLHLKLDKFVAGRQQRIFKTTDRTVLVNTNFSKTQVNASYDDAARKEVFFGKYYSAILPNAESFNKNIVVTNLINFHDINIDYLTNKPNKYNVTITNTNNDWFNKSVNNAIFNTEKNNDQRVKYFPSYINTPIDIVYFKQFSYFLLPLSTDKYINIVQPNYMRTYTNFYNAQFKPNYGNALKQFMHKDFYSSQDNSIPIYNVNFNFLQTINLKTTENVFNWLSKYNLGNTFYIQDDKKYIVSSQIVYNSKLNSIDQQNPDSIYLTKLLSILSNYYYLFGEQTQQQILQDLINNIDKNSILHFLQAKAQVTSLNNNIIQDYVNDSILSDIFKKQHVFNVSGNLTNIPYNVFSAYTDNSGVHGSVLPQNILLGTDMRYSLDFNDPYIKQALPSAYFNILYLKNNRDPHYEIHCSLPQSKLLDYEISIDIPNYISGQYEYDKLSGLNKLYDYDITYSTLANTQKYLNNFTKLPIKNVTDNLLTNASIKDLVKSYNTQYNTMFPTRLQTKIDDYMSVFSNYHIVNNKLYNVGECTGLRNYIKTGICETLNSLWLSYKYKSTYDKTYLDSFDNSVELPFAQYTIDRNNNWLYDVYGNKVTYKIMKFANQLCPWCTNDELLNINSVNLTEFQKTIGCPLQKFAICSGFCIFPANKMLNTPNGVLWDANNYILKNSNNINSINAIWEKQNITKFQYKIIDTEITNCFIIPSAEIDRTFFADGDIYINDDLQIIFTKDIKNTIIDFQSNDSIQLLTKQLKGVFQGFKSKQQYSILNTANYDNSMYYLSGYMLANNTPFNGPHIITDGTQLSGYNFDTLEQTNVIPSGYYIIMRVRSWFSNTVKCTGKIKFKPAINNQLVNNVLQHVSKYDFVENVKGFFKLQQQKTHKSNIYSIKLTNSGLNPEIDQKIPYYTKLQAAEKLQKKNYLNKQLIYSYIYGDSFYETTFIDSEPFNYELKPITFQISSNIINNESNMIENTNTIDIRGMEFSSMNIRSYPFLEVLINSGWKTKIINGITYYYNQQEQLRVSKINKFRKDLRALLQNIIRESVKKYMPAHTNLWKIIYNGK